jgi:hypothetical protein
LNVDGIMIVCPWKPFVENKWHLCFTFWGNQQVTARQ